MEGLNSPRKILRGIISTLSTGVRNIMIRSREKIVSYALVDAESKLNLHHLMFPLLYKTLFTSTDFLHSCSL
jgi:hypothetical protein